MNRARSVKAFCVFTCIAWMQTATASAANDAFEQPPIHYSTTAPRDAIATLKAKLASGSVRLEGDERQVLRTLLTALNIPESSQLLIFSKTSLQRDRIDPAHPRALYFNDEIYVGWCPGGLAEVAAIDPLLGPVFYKFDPRLAAKEPLFERDADCLRCHGGAFIRDIPALLARSVYTDGAGEPMTALGTELVDSLTPFEQRYGGWYVTGLHGTNLHRGNLVLLDNRPPSAQDLARGANLKDLGNRFDARPYLRETSDLVALLVFEHQLTVQNALTRANQRCMSLMAYQQGVQRDLNHPVTVEPEFSSVEVGFADAVQQVLDALLSKDEAPLPRGGIRGIGGFTEEFDRKRGIGRRQDPSLKELDLQGRLFKYRCSYLIQSQAFENLQPSLRKRVLRRLGRIIAEPSADRRYAYLEPHEREMIRRIVLRTVSNLPPNWKSGA
jgi:hypothetical protein